VKDFRVNVRVTNANIQRSIEGMGYTSIPKWCEDFNYQYATLNQYISLKLSPIGIDGSIKGSAQKLCDLLGESFDELFSEHQRDALKTNRASVDVSFDDLMPMLTSDGTELLEAVYTNEKNEALRKTLNTLTPREAEVLRLRNGVDRRDELTLLATANTLGITQERARQIEGRALRKMRGPDRSQRIKQFVEEA